MSTILRKVLVVCRFFFAVLGGICILSGLSMIVTSTGETGPGLMAIVIGIVGIWFTRWVFGRALAQLATQEENPKSNADNSNEEITRLYDELSSGNFPVIANPPVNLKTGEVAHHVCLVEVRQLKTETKTYRGYGGTRIKIGKIPLFFGGSAPQKVSREVVASVGMGNLVITNKRVVLSGTKVNYSIKLDQINDLKLFKEGIQIMNEGAYGGRFYVMDDPKRPAVILHLLIS